MLNISNYGEDGKKLLLSNYPDLTRDDKYWFIFPIIKTESAYYKDGSPSRISTLLSKISSKFLLYAPERKLSDVENKKDQDKLRKLKLKDLEVDDCYLVSSPVELDLAFENLIGRDDSSILIPLSQKNKNMIFAKKAADLVCRIVSSEKIDDIIYLKSFHHDDGWIINNSILRLREIKKMVASINSKFNARKEIKKGVSLPERKKPIWKSDSPVLIITVLIILTVLFLALDVIYM